ncbi:MAG TPA: sulfatase [Opitutaceae bacterium]|nr:sulfatase [Opitutaceae bacterium]
MPLPSLTRRTFVGRMAGATAAAAAVAALPRSLRGQDAASPKRPLNVVWFMSDDMRPEIGCYGSRFGVHTPHLDALAASGVRFDRNYCQFPLCNPSRTSLMTNRHPTTTEVLGNRQNFRPAHPDWVSLPQLFKNNGYTSMRSGKIFHDLYDDAQAWTLGGGVPLRYTIAGGHALNLPHPPFDQIKLTPSDRLRVVGLTEQNEPDFRSADHATAYVLPAQAPLSQKDADSDQLIALDGSGEGHPDFHYADAAIQYLRENHDRPFFLGCGFAKPHSPPCAPRSFFDLYDPARIELPPNFAAWPTVPAGFPSAAFHRSNGDLFMSRGASEQEARLTIQAYLASITFTDWNIGRVLAELDRLGLRENTIVVFIVDHGYQLGENGKWSKHGSLFDAANRVPLIVSAPGMAGNGRTCTRIVQSIDVYSTVAELCGLSVPPEGEGVSLVPLLRNPDAAWDKPAYTVWSDDSTTLKGVSVRNERWHYVEYGPEAAHGAMLFDVRADPQELRNLAYETAHSSTVADLSKLTRAYAARLGQTAHGFA